MSAPLVQPEASHLASCGTASHRLTKTPAYFGVDMKILAEHTGASPKQAVVDLGFRGVNAANPGIKIIHRGCFKTLTDPQRHWLRHRQAVEPVIGHLKNDQGMNRCWLKGQTGDALHVVLRAAGFNIR